MQAGRSDGCSKDTASKDGIVRALMQLTSFVEDPHLAKTADWPDTIGGFRILDELAWSGQSVTFLAYDAQLKRNVVLKMYYGSTSDQGRDAILAEGQKLAMISSPNVARCFGTGQYAESPFLVLEHIDGVTLADTAAATASEAAGLVRKIAQGLQSIHDAGLSHGDIKPSNIVVDQKGVPHLIDLGSSTAAGATGVETPSTAAYLAPERAGRIDGFSPRKADIFSLGGVLCFLLTNKAPFDAKTTQDALSLSRSNTITPVRDLAPNAPEKLVRICEKCLASDPNQRFASADEVALALEMVPKRPRMKLAVPATIGLLSAVCIAGILMLWSTNGAGSEQNVAQSNRQSKQSPPTLPEPDGRAGMQPAPPIGEPPTQPQPPTQGELLQSALEQGLRKATMGSRDDSLQSAVQFASENCEATSLASMPLDNENRVILEQPASGEVRFVIAPTGLKPTWVQILSCAKDAKGCWGLTPVTHAARNQPRYVRVEGDPVEVSTPIECVGGQTEYLAILTATTAWDDKESLNKTFAVLDDDSTSDTHRGVGTKIRYSVRVFEYVVVERDTSITANAQFNIQDPKSDYLQSLDALKNGNIQKARRLGRKLKALAEDPLTNNRAELASNAEYVLSLCGLRADLRTQITAADERVMRYGNPMGRDKFPGPLQLLVNDYELRKEHLGETHLKTAESLYLLSIHQYQLAEQDADRKKRAADQLWSVRNIFYDRLGAHRRTHQWVEFSSMLLISQDDPSAMQFARENHILATALYGPDSQTPQPVRIGHAMVQKAAALIRNGRWVDGRQTCIAANEMLKNSPDPLQFIGLMTMGQILAEEGDHEQAIEYFKKAAAGFGLMSMADIQTEILGFVADSHLLLGNRAECLETIHRAKEVAAQLSTEVAETVLFESQVTYAKLLLARGKGDKAIELLRGQVAKCRKRSGKGQLEVAMRELADALTARGKWSKSEELHSALIDRATRGKPFHNVQGLALCHEMAGRNSQAFELYVEAFEGYLRLAKTLSKQQSAFQRFQYTERIRDNLAGLLRTGSDKPSSQLYKFVFHSKGLSSRALAQQYRVERKSPQQRLAKQELRRKRDAMFSNRSATRDSLKQLRQLELDSEEIEKTLAKRSAEESALSMDEVLAELPENTAIIDFVKIARSLASEAVPQPPVAMAFVLSRDDNNVQVTHELISRPKGIDADWDAHWAGSRGVGVGTETIKGTDKPTNSDDKEKEERRQAALKSISKAVQQTLRQIPMQVSHVVVCPDSGMHRVPWAALRTSGKHLVERHAITFSESARDYLATSAKPSRPGDTMLAVGGVDFKGTQDPLPHSLAEANDVAALNKRIQATVLTKNTVTVQALQQQMGKHAVIHLATHAHYGLDDEQRSKRNPLLAAYVVVSGGAKIHGDEIASWDLSGTRLVTLSACEGAAGKTITGEGVLGLERSFRFGGALEVISNLVRVSDEATKEFMIAMNKNLLEMSPTKALQATQRKWIQDKKPVGTWANWRLSR